MHSRYAHAPARHSPPSAIDAVLFLTVIYLVIDSVNGYLLQQGMFSISMPYKILLLLLITLVFKLYAVALASVLALLFFLLARILMSPDVQASASGLDMMAKFASIPIFFLFFRRLLQREGAMTPVYWVARVSFVVLAINIVLGSLGYGYAAYSGGGLVIGAKGFIFAGNELGLALFLSGALVLVELLHREHYKAYIVVSLAWVALSVLSALKVGTLTALSLFVLFPLIKFSSSIRDWRVDRRLFGFTLLIATIGPLVAMGAVFYLLFHVGLWERISFFLGRMDWVTTLLSERNLRAEAALAYFVNDYSAAEQLLGRGTEWMTLSAAANNVEMDPIDFLMRYGLVGALIPYVFFLSVLFIGMGFNRQMPLWREMALIITLILLISVVAGHVLYSGTAAPLIGAVLAVMLARPAEVSRTPQRRLLGTFVVPPTAVSRQNA